MPLLLIDGNSLTYRAFFALPTDLATASGQVTNAVFGFTSMLINLLRDHHPDAIAVAFDRPEPTFRHDRVETYKANRAEAPDILRQQMGLVRQVIDGLAIPTVEKPGFEADDVIATLATQARDAGREVIVVTGDRDVYQLVEDPYVKVLYNRRGVSDYVLYDEAGIAEKTGVPPDHYVTYAALRGDTSDNLPGVPGVGEKTAAKLVNTYGDLDGVFAHVDEQPPKLRTNLADHETQARLNAEIMVLVRDLDLDVTPADLSWKPDFDAEEVRRLFDFLEFRTLYERLAEAVAVDLGPAPGGAEVLEAEVRPWGRAADAVAGLRAIAAGPDRASTPLAVGGWWDGMAARSRFHGLAVVTDSAAGEVAWLPAELLDGADSADRAEVRAALAEALGAGPVVAHDAKAILRELLRRQLEVATLKLDTQIAAYLLDPAEARYVLDELLIRYAKLELPQDDGAPSDQLDLEGTSTDVAQLAGRHALAVDRLVQPLSDALARQGLSALHDDIEVPLIGVLARMEHVGVGVDAGELERLNERLKAETVLLTEQIQADAGHQFNVNSTVQLREVLFDELALSPTKRTKTGYSTDAASLEKLLGQHDIIEHLLRYREVEKLRSTYGEGLLAEIDPADGRIHATFNQTVARTGRLSSDAPNLHNIPVRTDEGRTFRRAFVPAPGYELLVADYNQIELRCIAHLAEDPGLIAAFEAGDDIHNATASRVFGVEPSAVNVEQRSKAKMVSYGLAYGMESYGLAQRLNIEVPEAAAILDAYFRAFPSVKAYMERTVAEARQHGYTVTLFGRRRPIPELLSDNYRIRQAGERQAMNAGIQGLAADIFKVALVRLDHELRERGLGSRLILQVHDEVLVEVPPEEHDAAAELTREVLVGAADLCVPLEVNLCFGASWADAKS